MKIIYCHTREMEPYLPEGGYTYDCRISSRGGTTVAMHAIQSWLLPTLRIGDFIERKVGVARCSKDDNYNKKIGRDLATARMKATTLTVINIFGDVVFFEDTNGNMFEFKKSKDPHCAILVRILDDN